MEMREKGWLRAGQVRKRVHRTFQAGLDLVFPPQVGCLVCGGDLLTRGIIDLCHHCLERLPLVGDSFCCGCGRPLPPSKTHCQDCTELQHFFVQNRAVAIYSGPLKEQIQGVKYRHDRRLGVALGEVMGLVAKRRRWIPRGAHLLSVPLHHQRLRQRGYNQAELLLQGIERYHNGPILKPGSIIRREATDVSSKLSPLERRRNLQGVFFVPRPGIVAGKVLCVIDDIYTTGATLDEIARTLLKAGAKEVHGLTLSIAVSDQDLLNTAATARGLASC